MLEEFLAAMAEQAHQTAELLEHATRLVRIVRLKIGGGSQPIFCLEHQEERGEDEGQKHRKTDLQKGAS